MAVKNNNLTVLTEQMNEIIERSNQLNIPLSIAFEVNHQVELLTNNQLSKSEQYKNIVTLHESQGRVGDFLLEICKVNKVKSRNAGCVYTMTNPQTQTTKH